MNCKYSVTILGILFVTTLCLFMWQWTTPVHLQANFTTQQEGSDYVVLDNQTRLMWEVKTVDNWTDTFHWPEALTYCETTMDGYAGHNDWRLPSVKELRSIVDLDHYNPSIDQNYFPRCQSSYYWSATSRGVTDCAWHVDFNYGNVNYNLKTTDSYYVRCCRSF